MTKTYTPMYTLIEIGYANYPWVSTQGAGLPLAAPAFLEGGLGFLKYSPTDWAMIFYLGFFGTVLGFLWYYEGIQKIGPTRAGLFINFVPVSAILLAFIFLKEPLTMSLLIGTVMVSFGVYLTNRPAS